MTSNSLITFAAYIVIMTLSWYVLGYIGIPLGFIITFILDRSFTNMLKQDIIDALTNAPIDKEDRNGNDDI